MELYYYLSCEFVYNNLFLYMQQELFILSALYFSSNSISAGVLVFGTMSTEKVEINRLNNSMDETAKIIQELKAELKAEFSRRKPCTMGRIS